MLRCLHLNNSVLSAFCFHRIDRSYRIMPFTVLGDALWIVSEWQNLRCKESLARMTEPNVFWCDSCQGSWKKKWISLTAPVFGAYLSIPFPILNVSHFCAALSLTCITSSLLGLPGSECLLGTEIIRSIHNRSLSQAMFWPKEPCKLRHLGIAEHLCIRQSESHLFLSGFGYIECGIGGVSLET